MNRGKLLSGIAALGIYLGLIFLVLFFYNIHKTKAKNYVEKDSQRVTVTLVNSDKTVLNKSDKVSNRNRPTPTITPPIPVKTSIKEPKREPKEEPKKIERASKPIPKPKVAPKEVTPKKVIKPKVVVPQKEIPKKEVPKKIVPKKEIPKKVVPPKKTQSAKDLFSSVKTKDVSKEAIKKRPQEFTPPKEVSSIKHSSSVTDRIKSSHQSGTVSNANREKGVENAYIAKVKRHMNNWSAEGSSRGQRVEIELTIYSSGKFRYRVISGVASSNMESSLRAYLDTLNRMGLGPHNKSTPYIIEVKFSTR